MTHIGFQTSLIDGIGSKIKDHVFQSNHEMTGWPLEGDIAFAHLKFANQ